MDASSDRWQSQAALSQALNMFQNSPMSGSQSPIALSHSGAHSPGYISAAAPYRMHVSQRYLDLTRQKLQITRLPRDPQSAQPAISPSWDNGVSKADLESILDNWVEQYNWRAREAHFNDALPQFRASVNGARLHFVHKTSLSPMAIPLLCVHAWPESFISVANIIDDLTNPVASPLRGDSNVPAFHVVAPSIPGCGFSDQITEEGNNIATTAEMFDALMKSLGYTHYIAHGVGWGFRVCRAIALAHPESCIGVHTANPVLPAPRHSPFPYAPSPTASHNSGTSQSSHDGDPLGGEQPPAQTVAYSLSDSPSGLLAYMMSMTRARRQQPTRDSGASSPAMSGGAARSTSRSPLADPHSSQNDAWNLVAYTDWTMLHWLPGPENALRWVANSIPMLPSLWSTHTAVPLAITLFDEPPHHQQLSNNVATASHPSSPTASAVYRVFEAEAAAAVAESYHRIAFARRVPSAPPLLSRFPAWERPNEIMRDIRQLAMVLLPSLGSAAASPGIQPASRR